MEHSCPNKIFPVHTLSESLLWRRKNGNDWMEQCLALDFVNCFKKLRFAVQSEIRFEDLLKKNYLFSDVFFVLVCWFWGIISCSIETLATLKEQIPQTCIDDIRLQLSCCKMVTFKYIHINKISVFDYWLKDRCKNINTYVHVVKQRIL